jgi:hypothetical protein
VEEIRGKTEAEFAVVLEEDVAGEAVEEAATEELEGVTA